MVFAVDRWASWESGAVAFGVSVWGGGNLVAAFFLCVAVVAVVVGAEIWRVRGELFERFVLRLWCLFVRFGVRVVESNFTYGGDFCGFWILCCVHSVLVVTGMWRFGRSRVQGSF